MKRRKFITQLTLTALGLPFISTIRNQQFQSHSLNCISLGNMAIETKELFIKKGLILNNTFQILEGNIAIYPSDYFYPLNYFTGKTTKTNNTIAIHHYDSSWMSGKQKNLNKIKVFLIRIFGEKIIFSLIRLIKK